MKTNRVIQTFLSLVKIPSPSGREEDVMAFLDDYLRGIRVRPLRDSYGNMVIKIHGFGEPLLLSAHTDTVEPCLKGEPVVKNNVITSDGKTILGSDNKAAVASILEVLKQLEESPIPHRPLDVVFTRSEEEGSYGAVNLDYSLISAKEGYTFDDGEPVGKIVQGSPYYYQFDIKITGKSAHSSEPENAVNALIIFADAMKDVVTGRVNESVIANIGEVHGGYVRNTIIGEMRLKGEVRSFYEAGAEKYLQELKSVFCDSADKYSGTIAFNYICENPGYIHSEDDSFVKRTMKIMKNININPIFHMTYGCSDANVFSSHGIKVLDLGDGTRNPHTVDECIGIDDLGKLVELIRELIK